MGSPNGNKETLDELRCKRKRDAPESGKGDGRVDAGKGEDGRVDDGELKVSSDGSKGKDDGKAEMPSQAEGENITASDDANKLIACKTCSQTYHVKCVSLSSLESIPEDWECLNCTDDIDFMEPLVNFKRSKKEILKLKNKCYICSTGKRRLIIIPKDQDINSLLKPTSDQVVESDKNGTESQEDGAAVSDAGTYRAILKQNLDKINNNDKLLMLRRNSEACSKSDAEELKDKSVEKSNNKPDAEKGATTHQSDQEKAEAFKARLERLANLRKMQREKAASKKKNEVTTVASDSTAVDIQMKKNSDLQIMEKDDDEGVAMMIDPKNTGKGGETGNSASKGLITGQDKIPPNSASHLKNVSAASGSNPRRPTSSLEADTTTKKEPRRPWLLVTKPNQKPRSKSSKQKQNPEPEQEPEPPVITWHDHELDALWVGVRRHGQGNWEKILEDSSLLFGISCKKTPQDLSKRWEIETQKIFPSAVALSLTSNNNNNNNNIVVPNHNSTITSNQREPQPQLQPQRNALERNNNNNVVVPNPSNTNTTDQGQPQPQLQPQLQPQPQQNAVERNNNNSGGYKMMLPGGHIVPHSPNMPAGINIEWHPCTVENQGIVWMPHVTSNAGGLSNFEGFSSSPSMASQMAPASAPQIAPTPGGPFNINGSSSTSLPKDSKKAPTSTPQRAPTQGGPFNINGSSSTSFLSKDSQKAPTSTPQRAPTSQGTPSSILPKVSKKACTSASRRVPKPGITGGSSSAKVSHNKAPTSPPQRAPTQGNTSYNIQGSSSSSSKKTPTSAPQRASSSPMISDRPSFIQTPLPSSSSSKVSHKAPTITPQRTPAPGDPYVLALPASSSKVSHQMMAASAPQRTLPLPAAAPSGTSSSNLTSLLAAQILAAAGAAKTTPHQWNNSTTTMIPTKPLSSLQAAAAASTSSAENENNNDEPRLLLGGCFTLPKFVVLNKKKNDVTAAAASNNNNKNNEKAKDKEPMEHAAADDTSSE